MSDQPVVEAGNLGRDFAETRAVDSLSFTVESNEIFGLVGPDGAGKTTTLRMLAGILEPSAGQVSVNGTSVIDAPETVKAQIGYMSQQFGLYRDLSVKENLDFYGDLFGLEKQRREARISELLRRTGMDSFRERPAGDLSGGMKQKLYLSCTLLHQPELLILDEPTNGVDPISRREFWKILYELVEDGLSVVVTTAYLDEAERCSRVGLMDEGTLLASGTPAELKNHIDATVLEIRTSDARRAMHALREDRPGVRMILFGDRFHYFSEEPGTDRSSLESWFEQSSFELTTIDRIDPGLEDVLLYELKTDVASDV